MIFLFRRWPLLLVVGCGCLEAVRAQDAGASSGGSSSSGSSGGTGSSSAFSSSYNSGSSGSALGSQGSNSASSSSGSSSAFSVYSSAPQGGETSPASGTTPGTSTEGSAFSGTSFGNAAARQAAPSFTVPGLYWQGTTTFFGGSGRLARPKFEVSLTFGAGYDDNLYQTPSSVPGVIPGVSQVVQTGEEPVYRYTTTHVGGFPFLTTREQIGTRPITEEVEVVPPQERQQRQGSLFTREGLSLEMQRYSQRSLFVLDANLNRSYYLDRDSDKTEYNGALNLTYLYRLSPRLQATGQINAAYISQPDLTRVNTPQNQISGDLLNFVARADLAYRVTPRFSLTLSGNYSGNRYTEKSEQSGDYDEYTFGLEARFLHSPRWTWLAEYRHSMSTYDTNTSLDSETNYLLLGSEFIVTRRLTGSLRVGEAIKSFKMTGDSQSAPYVESTVTYQSTNRSSVSWTNRFGFEEPQSPQEERLVYRSNIGYNYVFTPHLRSSANLALIHELRSADGSDTIAQDTFECTLGLEYQLSKTFSLNASYTFTLLNSNIETNEATGSQAPDYYRNRIFLGGQYSF